MGVGVKVWCAIGDRRSPRTLRLLVRRQAGGRTGSGGAHRVGGARTGSLPAVRRTPKGAVHIEGSAGADFGYGRSLKRSMDRTRNPCMVSFDVREAAHAHTPRPRAITCSCAHRGWRAAGVIARQTLTPSPSRTETRSARRCPGQPGIARGRMQSLPTSIDARRIQQSPHAATGTGGAQEHPSSSGFLLDALMHATHACPRHAVSWRSSRAARATGGVAGQQGHAPPHEPSGVGPPAC